MYYGAQAWLHFRANGEISYTGRTVPTPKTNVTQFTVSQGAAENIAKADLQKKYSFTDRSIQALKDLHLLPFETEKICCRMKIHYKANWFGISLFVPI
jgi:hypothetical protein